MGWQTQNGKSIGDEPVDLLSECIERIVKCYSDELGRGPTLEELLESIRQALHAHGSSVIPQLAEREVIGLLLKTRHLPKTQKFEVGDCFAIPIDGEFMYGRILKSTTAGRLVEIYDLRTSKRLPFSQFLKHPKRVVWQKHVNGVRAFRNRRWLIIGRQDVPKRYKFAAFYTGTPFTGFLIDRGGKVSRSDELSHDTDAEPMIMFSPDTVEIRIASNAQDPWPEVEQVRKRDVSEPASRVTGRGASNRRKDK